MTHITHFGRAFVANALWGHDSDRRAEVNALARDRLLFGGPTEQGTGMWSSSPYMGVSTNNGRMWRVSQDLYGQGKVLLRPSMDMHQKWLGPEGIVLMASKELKHVIWRAGWSEKLPTGVQQVPMDGLEEFWREEQARVVAAAKAKAEEVAAAKAKAEEVEAEAEMEVDVEEEEEEEAETRLEAEREKRLKETTVMAEPSAPLQPFAEVFVASLGLYEDDAQEASRNDELTKR
jgi:hypothetical protein